MDLRNSVEMLRESIDKQSKELAHVSRDTKKLKKLELHRQRDNDARRAGGELEPLHVLRTGACVCVCVCVCVWGGRGGGGLGRALAREYMLRVTAC